MKVKIRYLEVREHEAVMEVPADMENSLEIFATDQIINCEVANSGRSRTLDFQMEFTAIEDEVGVGGTQND